MRKESKRVIQVMKLAIFMFLFNQVIGATIVNEVLQTVFLIGFVH